MAIRLSGMNSGLDTDAIVKALVSGYTSWSSTIAHSPSIDFLISVYPVTI